MSDQPQRNSAPTEKDVLTGHAYDGIEEFDNPLPGWWVWIFWLTVAFAAIYLAIDFGAGDKYGSKVFYESNKAALDEKVFGAMPDDIQADNPTIVSYSQDAGIVSYGKGLFKANCASCHGQEGQGVTCPNLTDHHYIWVTQPADIYDVIAKGRKGVNDMPSWDHRFDHKELIAISAYVASIRGNNIATDWVLDERAKVAPDFTTAE